tara:strand:+ start:176 stop:781 length:606 start_codon:yes stop_codon:yes gene_type:complete
MKLIYITGPSGSGKTTISKIILKRIKYGIILNTDNYYKTGIISKILSKILVSYFDRKISFNLKLFKKDIEFIIKNGFSDYYYKYNFKRKSIKKIYKKTKNIRFIIIEGIFGQELIKSLSKKNCILIKLKIKKETCMKRVIKRDFKERGKSKYQSEREFIKAWQLFNKNKRKYNSSNYLKKIVIRKKSNINLLIKKITNIMD